MPRSRTTRLARKRSHKPLPLTIFYLASLILSHQLQFHPAAALNIFSPSKKPPPLSISQELGTSPALNYTLFDPLDLANDDNFATYREAELKHGRVAMLATIGMVLPDFFRFHDIYLSKSLRLRFDDVPCGLKALKVVPWQGWLQIIAFVGILETRVFIQKDIRDMPGDYGVGYFGTVNKAKHERSLKSELENGRLAMIAFIVQVFIELLMEETVGEQWIKALSK